MNDRLLVPKFLDIDGCQVPLRVSFGRRNNIRFSFTNTGINFLCPYHLASGAFYEYLDKLRDWGRQQFAGHPRLRARYQPVEYRNGQIIDTCFRRFTLKITENARTSSGIVEGESLHIKVQPDLIPFQRQKVFSDLLGKLLSHHLLRDTSLRVLDINTRHFNQHINNIKLRNNQSRWGSCSSSGNINLSTRLLLAPLEVVDYVIVHELAHRIEMNHSAAFWAEVARVMPNYEQHENWLKKEGGSLRF